MLINKQEYDFRATDIITYRYRKFLKFFKAFLVLNFDKRDKKYLGYPYDDSSILGDRDKLDAISIFINNSNLSSKELGLLYTYLYTNNTEYYNEFSTFLMYGFTINLLAKPNKELIYSIAQSKNVKLKKYSSYFFKLNEEEYNVIHY